MRQLATFHQLENLRQGKAWGKQNKCTPIVHRMHLLRVIGVRVGVKTAVAHSSADAFTIRRPRWAAPTSGFLNGDTVSELAVWNAAKAFEMCCVHNIGTCDAVFISPRVSQNKKYENITASDV